MQDDSDNPPAEAKAPGLVPAIQNLTDGVSNLIRSQFELLRIEAKREVTEAGRRGSSLLLWSGVALLGYGMLLFSAVLLVGWAFGIGGMAIASLVLGLAHMLVGLLLSIRRLQGFEEQHDRLEQKTRSLTGTDQWLEEKPEN